MKLAKTLMIQGTSSSVGKSALVTGLCRLFVQEGYRVAPFKAQNMSLNAAVTRDGLEISRAQAVQAEAAGIEPTVQMNPILLKPQGDSRSQVIVMGRPLAALEAQEYYRHHTGFAEIVQSALQELRTKHDLVIIEGAGSPVEINLKQYDLVNMRVAELADAPVLLVGDIDRGGIFAALLGTLMLLRPGERERVKGLIVNKFRGDIALWHEGERMVAERAGVPVLGTIPFIHNLHLAEEDAVALDEGTAYVTRQQQQQQAALRVVLIRLPYLSNYDEFDALAAEPGVHLSIVAHPDECPAQPDLIILPGTKNTFFDLAWLWQQGLANYIRQQAKRNCAILGICGGYQMLGERLRDPAGAEASAGSVMPGLNLLPLETTFAALSGKITQQSSVTILPEAQRGLFAYLSPEQTLCAYQIHVGRSVPVAEAQGDRAFQLEHTAQDGWISADGWCTGCYLHGLFENDHFRHAIVRVLQSRRADMSVVEEPLKFDRQHEYDRLATVLRQHLDVDMLKTLL